MIRGFALLLLTSAAACSQEVAIQPAMIDGIEAIGPQSPEFQASVAQIVGTDPPSALTAWLSYGLVVRNNSPQALAGICVVWTAAFDAGPLGHAGGVSAQWYDAPSKQLRPGQAVLAIPAGILQSPRDVKPFSQGRGLGNLPNYRRAQRIGISVDSVVFAAGRYVGADTIGEFEQLQAALTVPRSLAETLLQKKATGTISDIVAWLQSLDVQSRQAGASNALTHQSGVSARGMLDVYQHRGETALYSMAANILQQPVFPLSR